MSLFRIFKGKKENLASQEKHDGYAWYTSDDAGFYIDSENDEGDIDRKKVNSASNVSIDGSEKLSDTNVQSALETLSDNKLDSSSVGEANGVASLDSNAKVPTTQLPIASSTTLGVFKVGANLSITSDGVLNASGSSGGSASSSGETSSYGELVDCTTVFNDDGSITDTYTNYIKTTVFNEDGSITETITDKSGNTIKVATTTFNSDGSITTTTSAS